MNLIRGFGGSTGKINDVNNKVCVKLLDRNY